MHPLAQNLLVYRTAGCYAVSYTGRPFIYAARKVSSEIGAASCNAVARVGNSHALMTPGDFIITDGTAVRSIGEGRVKRSIFAQITRGRPQALSRLRGAEPERGGVRARAGP